MTNKTAIKEIEKMRVEYYALCENYFSECGQKEAKEITDKISTKISALEIALVAMRHIEAITKI